MGRSGIEALASLLEASWRSDPFHAFRTNLASVADSEWDVKPAGHSVDVFGTQPELSIAEIALHVGGGLRMWEDRAFGNGTLEWDQVRGPSQRDRATVEAWLDDLHASFATRLNALEDDSQLLQERQAPGGRRIPVGHMVTLMINHPVYHAGEINRQRALIRGADGWTR
jgi:hypothetical protein